MAVTDESAVMSARIDVDLDSRVNFAMQQNDVPVIKALRIENTGPVVLTDVRLVITADPSFAEPFEAAIDSILPGRIHPLSSVRLPLSPRYLASLTERVRGQLQFDLYVGEYHLVRQTVPVTVLAFNEWGGGCSLPEIIAAFVMPNHPVVGRILRRAADILGGWPGSDDGLSGYQSQDPKRLLQMAAATYAALQEMQLSYINPPASFEESGQRIRLPDQIEASRMGTCLDLAVLTAGCLEQIGLHPLIVFLKDHSFVGLWLREDCSAEALLSEPAQLRKLADLREIAFFDPTLISSRPSPDFRAALDVGRRHLDDPDQFAYAVDVHRARLSHIRPLPESAEAFSAAPGSPPEETTSGPAPPPELSGYEALAPDASNGREETDEDDLTTRLEQWKRRLLDLSLRNRLLNFRPTKKSIPLLCENIGALEDLLAAGRPYSIHPRPDAPGETDPRDEARLIQRLGDPALRDLISEQFRKNRLLADLSARDLDRHLLEVYRATRLGIEEGGANPLYLAVGFLQWYESPHSQQLRQAPILLLPLEMQRRSAREGFTIRLSDDEPQINVTLLELLKRDFDIVVPGLDSLPMDDAGVDVAGLLTAFRRAILQQPRWDVSETVRIGIFSFAKFLMWRDLDQRFDELLKNAVVDHLINHPREEFEPGAQFPEAEALDHERSPLETFCPLPADATQLAAIFAASDGRSFVLQGPPGTGKSQTITNLIAHCLAIGKRVLFISAKQAALNVVYNRLQQVGLTSHCLALHSNKGQKRHVLDQLNETLNLSLKLDQTEWERRARRIQGLRVELDAYVDALHQQRAANLTVFQVTSMLIGLRDVPAVEMQWSSLEAVDANKLDELREVVARLATAGQAVHPIEAHPWRAVRHPEWTPAWEQQVLNLVMRLHEQCEILAKHAGEVSARMGRPESAWSWDDLQLLDELCDSLPIFPPPGAELLTCPDWSAVRERIDQWIEIGRRRAERRRQLLSSFKESLFSLDLDSLREQLQEVESRIWPASWWGRRPISKAIRAVALDATSLTTTTIEEVLESAIKVRQDEQALAEIGEEARRLLGAYWPKDPIDWAEVQKARDWAERLRSLASRAAGGNLDEAEKLRAAWARLVIEGQDLLRDGGLVAEELKAYKEAYRHFGETRGSLENMLNLTVEAAWGKADEPDALNSARDTLQLWIEHRPDLGLWCHWQKMRAEAMESNLGPLVSAYEEGRLQGADLQQVFDRSFFHWWRIVVVSSEPRLAQFMSPDHERKIQAFRDLDDQYLRLTQELIAARLAANVPSSGQFDLPTGEIGILKREIAKKRRNMSVRRLFESIPNLLARLKPCLLMSPLSVAQYLDASYPPFDLVVFDEASQLPPWDAVGSIARGKQAIIVGDSKQLPPTSFFQRGEGDDEYEEDTAEVADLESILEEAGAAGLKNLRLKWHYRSRHESLIAFSNSRYYNNELLTFPSAQHDGLGVSWRSVPEGVYDRGKSATNLEEAKAVVAEITRRLRDPELSKWTIGVVTFSQRQQTLIEDLLEKVRLEDPQVDAFCSSTHPEPLFVKNLENVQGDERDVMLFSICYGPDAQGRVAMNFGPMNREGGSRRLNVAITRARRELIVFSTLTADQIDLARTRSEGVADLKAFLDYARRGPQALAEVNRYDATADCESPFEEAVYRALREQEWEVHKQVGCARYRIDLAVVDPERPGRYLLGIECDGATYHSAKTARDRDKLREEVLRGLGWQLHRIWSTDWWQQPEREIEKLVAALEAAKQPSRPPAPTLRAENTESADKQTPADRDDAPTAPADVSPTPPHPGSAATTDVSLPVYEPYGLTAPLGTQAEFYEWAAADQIRRVLAQVVEAEGPVSVRLAARRVAARWGFHKVSRRVLERIRALSLLPAAAEGTGPSAEDPYLWPQSKNPETYEDFRVAGEATATQRLAEDLPVEEVANAMLFILRQNLSASEEDLVRGTGRLFGFDRVGTRVAARMQAGVRLLIKRGAIIQDGGLLTPVVSSAAGVGGAGE